MLHKSQSYCAPKTYGSNQFTVNEWMTAIRSPTQYRVGNARLTIKPRLMVYAAIIIIAILILLVYFIPSGKKGRLGLNCDYHLFHSDQQKYDFTYPLTDPIKTAHGTQYRIAIVTDLDTDSKDKDKPNTWVSYLKYGNLTISDDNSKVLIDFDKTVTLSSKVSEGGRGMELSELIVFNGKLYTVDDRTGIIYEIHNDKVIQRFLLTDGDGTVGKGIAFLDHLIYMVIILCFQNIFCLF